MRRPLGVTIVAVLTLLSAFALGFLYLVFYGLSVVGMGSGLPLTLNNLQYYLPLFFAFFALASSVSILNWTASKYLWYSSMVYWTILLIYFIPFAYMWNSNSGLFSDPYPEMWQYEAFVVTLFPLIYAVGCLAYFLTEGPREYFHVK
jgi:hypothetical protein